MIENDLQPLVGRTITDVAWGGDDPDTDSFFYLSLDDGSRLVVAADFVRHATPLRAIPTVNTWLRAASEIDEMRKELDDVASDADEPADATAAG